MEKTIDRRKLFKNTIYMYLRMLIVMAASLYVSRIVLDKLGVDDFGLYNVVAGVVGLLSFMNNTLSNATSRFITFELGRNSKKQLGITFSTAFIIHVCLAVFIVIIMESLGSWFFANKLNIPVDRIDSAKIVYQISILTTVVSILQVPFMACIKSHERFNFFALVGILEAALKLLVAFLITVSLYDKLVVYAFLLAIAQVLTSLLYIVYSLKQFPESRMITCFSGKICKKMMSFSGWNIIAYFSEMLKVQGSVVLLNMFFRPAVVAAQAISNQITNAVLQFVSNFMSALNPQIIKSYAEGDYAGSRKLTLQSTILVFDLMLLIGLPLIFSMEFVLGIWLVEFPDYTVSFTIYAIVMQIVGAFSNTLYIPMVASGKLKSNSVAAVFISIGSFIVLYVLYKLGFDVMWLQYLMLISTILYSFVVKPIILCREINYSIKELTSCYLVCLKTVVLPLFVAFGCSIWLNSECSQELMKIAIIAISVLISAFFSLDKELRNKVVFIIKNRISNADK